MKTFFLLTLALTAACAVAAPSHGYNKIARRNSSAEQSMRTR